MFNLKNQLNAQEITFCPAPYSVVDIRPKMIRTDGQRIRTTCCCNLDDELFTKTQQTNFDQIKQLQLQGQWPEECFRCKQDEEQELVSERILLISKILEPTDTDISTELLLEKTLIDAEKNFEIRIKFSNFCNLSCRMCYPTESSLHAKITGADIINDFYIDDISEDPKIWQLMIDTISQEAGKHKHTYVHLLGGETLLQPGVKKLVQQLIELNLQDHLCIRITSALSTQFDQELFDNLMKFKYLDLLLSIDGVGENYHYLRWPMTFDKLSLNFQDLLNHYYRCGHHSPEFMINIILSLNNIFYVNEILDYWTTITKTNVRLKLTTYPLVDRTDFMSIKALPYEYRPELITLLTQATTHDFFKTTLNTTFKSFIEGLIQSLQHQNFDPDLWHEYLNHTAFFDLKTKTNMSVHNKKFYNIWSTHDQELLEKIKSTTNTQVLAQYTGIIQSYNDQLRVQSKI